MINVDCDILVIGAGVLGLSSAYYLKMWNPDKRVVIVDMFGGPGQGNSAKSEGGFRNLFNSEANFLLADTTIDWFIHMEKNLGYDLKLSHIGYLWLYSQKQYNNNKNFFQDMKKRGTELTIYEGEQIKQMIPDLVTDFENDEEAELLGLKPVEYGVLGKKCGCIDTDALVRGYEQEFLKMGGEINYNTEVKKLILKPKEELEIPGEPFVWQDTCIVGSETSRGIINSETTIVAAGVWTEKLLNPIGLDSYMRPKKRQVFAFKDSRLGGLLKLDGFNKYGVLPLTILPKASILFRPEISEGSFWLTCSDNIGRAFGLEDDPQAEEDYYTNNIYHVLVKYFPCFEDVRPVNMWAGQYAINSFDEIPVVVPAPGMIYIGAASGSGIMKCDSLGRIVASLYAGKEVAELHGNRQFDVANVGIHERNVEKESLVI